MSAQPTKTCKSCNTEKPLEGMETFTKKGTTYYRSRCKQCTRERNQTWYQNNKDSHNAKASLHRKQKRKDEPDWAIHQDSQRSDRIKGLENDLTREFIRGQIQEGCTYCGETELRMTLDRINNFIGHVQSNVVPACIRCNYTRKDMPYKAWLILAKAMKKARGEGLFGCWTGRARASSTIFGDNPAG